MKQVLIGLVALLLVVGAGAALYFANQQNGTSTDSTVQQEVSDPRVAEDDTSNLQTENGITIVVNDEGFDKETYTVKAGESVTVRNNSSEAVQFSSEDHPTHLKHPELNMDVLLPGESGTIVAKAPGSYGFHDHLNEQYTGTLVVE